MSETKPAEQKPAHTPGPWKYAPRETLEDGSKFPAHILGGSRELVVCYTESQYSADMDDDLANSDVMMEAVGDVRSKKANAHLIAAAPDMYEALLVLLPGLVLDLRYANVDDDKDAMRARIDTVISALRKAEGNGNG